MSARAWPDPTVTMWHWLAFDLRFFRERGTLSGTEFGKIIGVVRSSVSRLEDPADPMKLLPKQAAALDKYFNTGGHFERLLAYAKLGHDPNWVREHFEREAKAEVIKIVEHSIVPGLFQTEDYMRAGFKAGGISDIENWIATRLARQAVLIRPNPPLVQAILGQSVIDTPVGGVEVMYAQLTRLIELSELDNVLIRVIPRSTGFHAGFEGAFKLLTVEGKDVAYAQAFGGGRLVMDATEVRIFGTWYDRLGAEALTRCSSRDLISEVRESMR